MIWQPVPVNPIDELEFVRGILQARELASRTAAHDASSDARDSHEQFAIHGYPFDACPNQPPTREEITAIIAKMDTILVNGDTIARAWLHIRARDLEALRAVEGEQLPGPGEVPPTIRQPRLDEREPMTLPPVEVVTQAAQDHGLLVPECEGVFNGCKFVNGVCEHCRGPAEREEDQ